MYNYPTHCYLSLPRSDISFPEVDDLGRWLIVLKYSLPVQNKNQTNFFKRIGQEITVNKLTYEFILNDGVRFTHSSHVLLYPAAQRTSKPRRKVLLVSYLNLKTLARYVLSILRE